MAHSENIIKLLTHIYNYKIVYQYGTNYIDNIDKKPYISHHEIKNFDEIEIQIKPFFNLHYKQALLGVFLILETRF